ncbi:DUF4404 family protein [Rhodopirellula sp. JC740]|uniref:DUF4404 family protein n=1 Tax=Rhodopirellula halodulae TaxID=2894198 RepID=A0ABS8NQG7_9BACT|nr:DUF4404 family protein [Rhodopirellula sp. JC740]MCC9645073.1 DUF4404 family protein [Rhodopirellula sp. JC740]
MRTELEATISKLHEQLADVSELNAEERERLRAELDEIRDTLDQQEVNSASLAERWNQQVEHFRESHPVLTENAGRVADMLSQMGI